MKKQIILFLATICCKIMIIAGDYQVSKSVLNNYSPSVIARVHGVTKVMKLSEMKQLEYAQAVVTSDSLIAVSINGNNPVQESKASKIVNYYDSLMYQSKLLEKSTVYANSKISRLDSLKTLTEVQKKKILKIFLTNSKLADCSFADAFRQSLRLTVSDTSYFALLYKDDIYRKSIEATNSYPLRNAFPMAILDVARNQIYKYQRELILNEYSFNGTYKEKLQQINNIDNFYKPKIDSLLIINGYYYTGTVFSKAVQLQKILKLTDQQINELNLKSIELNQLTKDFSQKFRFSDFDIESYNKQYLPRILNEDQYKTMMQLRLQKRAENACTDMWREMVKFGICNGNDSVKIASDIYQYNIDKLVINEIYQDNLSVRDAKQRDLDILFMPEIIKQLYKARRDARNKAKNGTESAQKTNFVW